MVVGGHPVSNNGNIFESTLVVEIGLL